MIPVNELRVGNWVRDTEVGFRDDFKVRAADILSIAKGDGDDFAPIPLTPEILLACGFKFYDDGKWRTASDHIFYMKQGVGFYAPNVMPEVKFVHQLQNLYFALTGTELEYRP